MTDREPDDLYDALRSRLADYGQEPPAPLWANIRAQLPPPVAAPQLRKRRRRSVAALLLLLLALVSTAGWQWWRVGQHRELAQQAAHRADQQTLAAAKDQNIAPATRPAAATAGAGLKEAGATTAAEVAITTAPGTATEVARANSAADATVSSIAATSPNGTMAGKPAAGTTSASGVVAKGTIVAARVTARGRETGGAAVALSRSVRKRRAVSRTMKTTGTAANESPALAAARTSQTVPPAGADAALDGTVAASVAGRSGEVQEAAGEKAAGAAGETRVAQVPAASAVAGSEVALGASYEMQARRQAALAPTELAALRLALPTDTLPRPPVGRVRRWAVQAVGGPAYTYRQLTSTSSLATSFNSAPSTINTVRTLDATGTVREQQEQAGTGLALALQVRRVLSGRWSLSAGLGYQEFALQRTYDVVTAVTSAIPPVVVSNPRPPITTYLFSQRSYRDTYRFLTVPVRLSYTLGIGKKLSYGLSGGADVAFYLGGNSAGADAARHAWGPGADSPNRALNLSLSGGVDLRYRVASRLELLAQPSATYFLNSLSKPVSGLTPRHLLGAGVLLGVSYDWR
ncbi:hypothetical protein MUN81_08335 [Hymenobacter sp. 5317J-9]|uniref:hypothetical protein n=1 Tax=Hymenobacter sp. 5317J-9 TaxID=2932250 RepID=UPI001FD665BD|nr:hypothetical protein [Hymenobacter sp. 5317J-9]UOQ99485.1 hypothetical protein MUN81_08335 [Hymenobacter sp. 5317J-9]